MRGWVCVVLALAGALSLSAAEAAAGAAERVGDLGRKECLVFEGTKTFSRAGIMGQLDMRLEFYGHSEPEAPLSEYLTWIETTLRQGYQHAGFAKADVKATADRAAQRVRVQVSEGPRFKCGGLKVTGLDAALTQQFTNLLQKAALLGETQREPGQPSFGWWWVEGDHASTDAKSMKDYERNATAALAELNHHGAEIQAEIGLDDSKQQAELRLNVKKLGVEGTLDRIEVDGLRVNSREDLVAFLELRPGMPIQGNLTNDIYRRLYESGRFSDHQAQLWPTADAGRFKLELTVFEYTNAPALKLPLRPEEQALLKLRAWAMDWQKRPEDVVFTAQALRQGVRSGAEVALGREGLAIVARQTSPTNPPVLRLGLIAATEHLGFYSGFQRSKLAGKPSGGQLETFLELATAPTDDTGKFRLSVGAGWSSKDKGLPIAMRLGLAPTAFVAMAHPRAGTCRIEQGVLTYRSNPGEDPAFEMTADAATGQLKTWRMTMRTNDVRLELRSELGAYARLLREIADGSADFKNGYDAQRPWSSSLALLGRDVREVLEKQYPESLAELADGPMGGPRDWFEFLTVLEGMPWSELSGPMDVFASATDDQDTSERFDLVLDTPPTLTAAASTWMRWLGGMILKVNDSFYPRGSWPWVVLRDATFLAAGEPRWATNDIARLAASQDLGPGGWVVAAKTLGKFDPRLAVTFSQRGAACLTPAALQADLRVLFRGEEAGPKFMRGVAQRAPALSEHELRTLMKLFGTNALPLALEFSAALKADPKRPPEDALPPVFERHWEKELRPQLLTVLAQDCLKGCQQVPGSTAASAAADAAGWLRDAAQHGYARAQMSLGQLYESGLGVGANPAEAAKWMREAAAQNYPHAACELGRLYLNQRGAENLKEAERWFRVGAKDNCTAAEIGLAQVLIYTEGATPAQQEEGLGWLRKAIEHGSKEADYYLGTVLEQRNQLEEAIPHYRKAAADGVLKAQQKLGDLLSDGVSTKADLPEAWLWFHLAGEQGDRMSAAQARRLERKLTPQQMQEARQRLREME